MDNLINSPIDQELSKLSPFELKGKIIELAFGQFAMTECARNFSMPEGVAGVPQKEGIASRFETWMRDNANLAGVDFLRKAYEYCLLELSADPNSLVEEWAGGIIGDNYPTPPRILPYSEQIIRKYLGWALCAGNPPEGVTFDLFAVEGSTAGMFSSIISFSIRVIRLP